MQDLYVISDLVNKSSEKQFVLPSGVTVNFIATFWGEILSLAESTSLTSDHHAQALKMVQGYAAKHPLAETSGRGGKGPVQTNAPPSPKRKFGQRPDPAEGGELEADQVFHAFDQYQNMTHREKQDFDKEDKNNAHQQQSTAQQGKSEDRRGYLDPQVMQFGQEDFGEDSSLLNQYWTRRNAKKKPKLDFSGRS